MADENSLNLAQNTYTVRFITRFYLFKAVMSERNRNKLPTNLPQLQNLVKRDPDSYREEVSEIVFTNYVYLHTCDGDVAQCICQCCRALLQEIRIFHCFFFSFLECRGISLQPDSRLCLLAIAFTNLIQISLYIPNEGAANAVIHVLNSCHPVAIV